MSHEAGRHCRVNDGRLEFWDGNTLDASIASDWLRSPAWPIPASAPMEFTIHLPAAPPRPPDYAEPCWFCRKGPRWCAICFECEQKLRRASDLEKRVKPARRWLNRGPSIFECRPLHVVVFALFWLALGCAVCTTMKP